MKVFRLFSVQWKNIYQLSKELAKRSGRSPISIFLDFLSCYKTRGTSWWNYMNFGFHFQTDPLIRDSFATEYKDNEYMNSLRNTPEMLRILMDKGLFNEHYKEFLGREYLDLRISSKEDYERFLARHDYVVIKPAFDAGGAGIEKMSSYKARELYEKFLEEGKVILEEVLVQDPEMSLFNPSSINTLRTCTCIDKKGKITLLYIILRIGRADSFVDNMCAGGLYTKLTLDGEVIYPFYSAQSFGSIYTHHPDTGLSLLGRRIPKIEEVKDLAFAMARKYPDAGYVGWDIAITPEGPVVVEGNERPSCDLPQTYIHLEKGRGLAEEYEKALLITLPRKGS